MDARFPEVRALGLDALIVRFSAVLDDAANRASISFADQARLANLAGVEEIASSLSSTFVRFDPLALDYENIESSVHTLLKSRDWLNEDLPVGRRHWTVPVALGDDEGPQIEEAARSAGRSIEELASMIATIRVRILALGFAPGQPYMGLLPTDWNIPRQLSLTPKVPAGALVMAVRQLIIFSGPAPTGWRQIGLTGFRPFRPDAENPIALAPGDEMSFSIVPPDELEGNGDGLGGATFELTT